jgi:cold shock CspA family protein
VRAINGQVEFYDEASAWGLVRGDDGCLYDLRGGQLPGPPLRLGERVVFDPQPGPGAPRAAAVRRLSLASAARGPGRT